MKPYNQLSLRTTIEVAFRRLESERSVRHAHDEEKARLEDQHAETQRRADRLGIEATTDPLTGLFNRRHLEHVLSREVSFGVREGHPVGLILLDLDRFKLLNDSFGHAAGDAVLVAVAAFLRARLRTYDIACRYGGEEIVIIVPGAQTSAAVRLAEHLRAGIALLAVPALGRAAVGLGATVTASFGVSSFPTPGTELDQVFHAADVALYRAKTAGRNRVVAAALPTGAAGRALVTRDFDR